MFGPSPSCAQFVQLVQLNPVAAATNGYETIRNRNRRTNLLAIESVLRLWRVRDLLPLERLRNEEMMQVEIEATRCLLIAMLFTFVAITVGNEPASGQQRIEFEGKQWAVNNADRVSVREYLGRTALQVRGRHDAFACPAGVDAQDVTIEVDIAAGSRCQPGVCFRGRADGQELDKIVLSRWARGTHESGSVLEQAVITRRHGTLVYLMIDIPNQRSSGAPVTTADWFHVKVVCRGDRASVYLDNSENPIIEVAGMLDSEATGTLGMCGSDFYFSDFRYTVH